MPRQPWATLALLLLFLASPCIADELTPSPAVSVSTEAELLSALSSTALVIGLLADITLSSQSSVPGAQAGSLLYTLDRNVTITVASGQYRPTDWYPVLNFNYAG